MNYLRKIRLEVIVFICGVCGMVLELVGSRVVSPYFGNSLFVWTSLIGVILGSLSLGYYYGGRMADKCQSLIFLAKILSLASIFTAITALFKEVVLVAVTGLFQGQVEIASIVAIAILFAPTSIILGIVSPYSARLKLEELKTSGSVVGNLYAISTFGSIIGTFFAGFYLIPLLGNTNILYLIALTLFIVSFFCIFDKPHRSFHLILVLLFFIYVTGEKLKVFKLNVVADVDSLYGRIMVKDISRQERTIRVLTTANGAWESAIYLDNPDELVFDYTKSYRLANYMSPLNKRALMIGGAAYTYPRDFLHENPNSIIDVVEIDAKMTEIAQKYFWLKSDPRMNVIHEDARTFVTRSKLKYDVVFLDAFMGMTPPPHLTTKEFMTSINNLLTNEGALFINLLGSVNGKNSQFFYAEANTLRSIFPRLDAYLIQNKREELTQNILLVAYKNIVGNEPVVLDPSLASLLSNKLTNVTGVVNGEILVDDHAPVEFLTRYLF